MLRIPKVSLNMTGLNNNARIIDISNLVLNMFGGLPIQNGNEPFASAGKQRFYSAHNYCDHLNNLHFAHFFLPKLIYLLHFDDKYSQYLYVLLHLLNIAYKEKNSSTQFLEENYV